MNKVLSALVIVFFLFPHNIYAQDYRPKWYIWSFLEPTAHARVWAETNGRGFDSQNILYCAENIYDDELILEIQLAIHTACGQIRNYNVSMHLKGKQKKRESVDVPRDCLKQIKLSNDVAEGYVTLVQGVVRTRNLGEEARKKASDKQKDDDSKRKEDDKNRDKSPVNKVNSGTRKSEEATDQNKTVNNSQKSGTQPSANKPTTTDMPEDATRIQPSADKQTNTDIPENTSGNDPLANYKGSNTSNNSPEINNIQKGYEIGQQITDGVMPMIEQWAAARERKWAAEREAYARHETTVNENRVMYEKFVATTSAFWASDLNKYCAMLKLSIPNLLKLAPITWEDILGTSDYDKLFGRDVAYVSKKVTVGVMNSSLAHEFKNNHVVNVSMPAMYTEQKLKIVIYQKPINYWVKTDFYDHSTELIFDANNICVGIRIALSTSNQEGQIHMKDYCDDLVSNLNSRYFMADGKTYVTSDKICVLDYNYLTVYDMNFLNSNTFFNFPKEYKQYFNPTDCATCINQLGIKIQGTRDESKNQIEIKEVLSNSVAEKNHLQSGDILLKINDIAILHPFHMQWFFHGFPSEKTLKLTIMRANKIQTININI